jgi:hypothetical protein
LLVISAAAACGGAPLPPPVVAAPPAAPDTPGALPEMRADPIPRIAFHDADGRPRTHFALDEPVYGTIQLPAKLQEIRELDDNPDLGLGVSIASTSAGVAVECLLPRGVFRPRDRISLELAVHPLANGRLDERAADVVIARDGAAATRFGDTELCRETELRAHDDNVHVRLAYHREDGSVIPLALGAFALDHAQIHDDLPPDHDAAASAQLLGWLNDRYRDTWFTPVRAVMVDPPWVTVRLDAFAEFRRDNGTCVIRFYSVNGRLNINHLAPFDRDVPCPPAAAPPTAPAAPAARSRRTR